MFQSRKKMGRDRSPAQNPMASGTRRLPSALLTAVDAGLIGAVFVVPFMMGGRFPSGEMALVVIAVGTAIAYGLYMMALQQRVVIWTRAYLVLGAACGLGLLQLTQLSPSWIESLSPHISKILPLWTASNEGGLGNWAYLSLTPAETHSGLCTFLAYVLLFIVTVQRIQRLEDADRCLRWISFAASAMALFGLVQYLTSNGKFFWFFQHPTTDTDSVPKGSFGCRNHFAQFLALGVGPLICYLVATLRQNRAQLAQRFRSHGHYRGGTRDLHIGLLMLALGLVVFTLLLSLSRGGTLALLVASGVCLTCLYRKKEISGRLLTAVIGTGTLVGAFLMIYGYEMVDQRLSNWESQGRLEIWSADLSVIGDFPLFGTGIGSHRYAYPMYLDVPFDGREYTHGENAYIQIASETGLFGLALAVTGLGFCFFWCVQGLRLSQHSSSTYALAAVSSSLAATAVHAAFDFNWYLPGCAVIITILAACACRSYQLVRSLRYSNIQAGSPRHSSPRWIGALATIGIGVLGSWMIDVKCPALAAESDWLDYRRLAFGPPLDEAEDALFQVKTTHLQATAKANPNDARIQLLLADKYRALFERIQQAGDNPMPVSQIRDAAVASQFESQEALNDWLERAFGDTVSLLRAAYRLSKRAVQLCPLQGQSYICLADLEFVENLHGPNRMDYYRQALLLRPYDAFVLFSAGREALLEGDLKKTLDYWRKAFHRDEKYSRQIIDLLAGQLAPEFLIENLKPDWASLGLMKQYYRDLNRPDEYRVVLEHHARASVKTARESEGETALTAWIQAQDSFDQMGMPDQALKCLQEALRSAPSSYRARRALAFWLYNHDRAAAAAEHLAWCARFKPRDKAVRDLAARALKESMKAAKTSHVARQPRSGIMR